MPYRIKLNHISFAYEGGPVLFKDIGFTAEPGEVVAIAGDVGSGKSTLLKIAAGLIEPIGGELSIDGKYFWKLTEIERNDIRRRMGFDFQEGALIANMTVFQNLCLPLRYHDEISEFEMERRVDGWIKRMDLGGYRDLLPAALSMGLKRRVSFIRAMLCGADAFFWDSPAEVVDDDHQAQIRDTIRVKKNEGVPSIIATGDAGYLADVVDRTVKI